MGEDLLTVRIGEPMTWQGATWPQQEPLHYGPVLHDDTQQYAYSARAGAAPQMPQQAQQQPAISQHAAVQYPQFIWMPAQPQSQPQPAATSFAQQAGYAAPQRDRFSLILGVSAFVLSLTAIGSMVVMMMGPGSTERLANTANATAQQPAGGPMGMN